MGKVMISLPGEFLKDVDNLAAIEHRNRSELFREAVRYYLQRKISSLENKPINNPQVKKALGIMEDISGKRLSSADAEKALSALLDFGLRQALKYSFAYNITYYDALFLSACVSNKAKLVTADKIFYNKQILSPILCL